MVLNQIRCVPKVCWWSDWYIYVHIPPLESVRSLGVVIAIALSVNAHVDFVGKAVNYHLKALRHIQ